MSQMPSGIQVLADPIGLVSAKAGLAVIIRGITSVSLMKVLSDLRIRRRSTAKDAASIGTSYPGGAIAVCVVGLRKRSIAAAVTELRGWSRCPGGDLLADQRLRRRNAGRRAVGGLAGPWPRRGRRCAVGSRAAVALPTTVVPGRLSPSSGRRSAGTGRGRAR